jgi:hypothetical protein
VELEPGLEPEHELEVLAPEPEDGREGSNDSTIPGIVQSSPRDFWTGKGPVQIATGLVRTGTGTVYLDEICPMSLGVSHKLSH